MQRWYIPFCIKMTRHYTLLGAIFSVGSLLAKDMSDPDPASAWRFEDKSEPGPRSPSYPAFATDNRAARFTGDGKKSALRVPDSPALRFGLGETITLEAWVKIASLSPGSAPYIIGKGRLGTKEFGKLNQNYALRLKAAEGKAQIGFLFASVAEPAKPSAWHRWWSTETFPLAGWHHLAVSFTFGKSKSLKAFIDGQETTGTWDMGGATDRAPVMDGDELLLGTGSTLTSEHSLDGWLDEVAIHRGKIDENLLKAFNFVPPPPAVSKKDVPAGRVLVQVAEDGMPSANAWPSEPPKVSETFTEDVFGFFDLPLKYVETGVRGERHVPFLYRAAALVTLPKGKHRLLLRARGATTLHVDGKSTLNTPFPPTDSDGHHLVADQKGYLDLGPDFRFAPPGNRESTCEITATGEPQLFVLETLVGSYTGKSVRRPELGETVVAWAAEGTEQWQLLSPGTRTIPYTDAGWAAYRAERNTHYAAINTEARAALRAKSAPYWTQRREVAQRWLAESPEPAIPPLPPGFSASNAVDNFIAAKIIEVSAEARVSGTVDYFRDVQQILEAKCIECHRGSKAKGGLQLDSLASAIKGGKSGDPAVTPGQPEHSSILERTLSQDVDEVMPPKGDRLSAAQIEVLTTWIKEGAHWPEIRADHLTLTPPSDDLVFLRRLTLDTVGVVPSLAELEAFQKNPNRAAAIDRFLEDPRWADHWMGYWQDVLAENPNILNPTLNNTGPFRWWLYESLQDNKPMDLFVTELLRQQGSERLGGPAGFSTASENDVPTAAKGTIVSTAFLGVQMKCARCHDSPTHKSLQKDLFQLAAMLGTKAVEVPTTSSVPMDKIHASGRKPLIQVTLMPGTKVEPSWPFPEFAELANAKLAEQPSNTRDALAALITAPQNERFAQVLANRLWARLMGRGIVEPIDDWEKGKPTHPEFIRWLGRQVIRDGYDLKKLARLILNSDAYQRATDPSLKATSPLFTSPAPRRLDAEQIVDSLFSATGKPFRTEEVCLDIDNTRDLKNAIHLGYPHRSWMLTSTSNERDRPSLALPRMQAITDLLSAFGWRGSRQDPITKRDTDPNVLQPAILSNGTVGVWLTRLSDDHGVTSLALQNQPLNALIRTLFLKLLTRLPTDEEIRLYTQHLTPGYDSRLILQPTPAAAPSREPEKYVSWSNHLDGEATLVRQAQETAARQGEPPTALLSADWRQRLEDVLWAILNAPEWAFSP